MGARSLGAKLITSAAEERAGRALLACVHGQIGSGCLDWNLTKHIRDETPVICCVIDHMQHHLAACHGALAAAYKLEMYRLLRVLRRESVAACDVPAVNFLLHLPQSH